MKLKMVGYFINRKVEFDTSKHLHTITMAYVWDIASVCVVYVWVAGTNWQFLRTATDLEQRFI